MSRLLVIDDDPDIRYSFERQFSGLGWEIAFAASGEEGLKAVAKGVPDAVLLDVRLGAGMDGLEALRRLRAAHAHLPVVMMTAHGTTQTAIGAMREGAFDYLVKPFDVERMREVIGSALQASRAMRERVSYQPLLQKEEYDEGIIGKAPAMQEVYKRIGQVSRSDAPVMITGETGTGKELVARAIVQHGPRAGKPFLAINCAAIPEGLLESELFGHERGAFTGALDRRVGKFEQCHGGTLLLDEIGDMPLATQAKLLRVLQEGELVRVGGNEAVRVDVRFIAATHADLEKAVAAKKFREDLYYRLNVVRIRLPPLRERLVDLPLLVDYFLARLARGGGKAAPRAVSREALKRLAAHPWPGNVRELQNAVERAAVVGSAEVLSAGDFQLGQFSAAPAAGGARAEGGGDLEGALDVLFREAARDPKLKLVSFAERALIARALAACGGNQVRAAKMLGITRATLRKRVERHGIRKTMQVG
jgi:two-component system nitrogen regulation response regulator GlnG